MMQLNQLKCDKEVHRSIDRRIFQLWEGGKGKARSMFPQADKRISEPVAAMYYLQEVKTLEINLHLL